MHIREAILADIPHMMELDRENPAAAHWTRQQYESLFAQDESQATERLILVAENSIAGIPPQTRTEETSQVRAFLVALRVESEWELENMVVSKTFQRQGIGMRLLNEFLEQARAEGGRAVFLEVRESNASARALYRKAGFKETGARTGYYADPAEDAKLYRLVFL